MKSYNLVPLWTEMLEIYSHFRRICQKYNLRCCTSGGTCLGAIRHKGFIPWDDDFDVFMPRPDYDKFLEVADKELPSHFRLASHRNCRGWNCVWCKIMDSRSTVIDDVAKACNLKLPQGIFIDIFPLNGFPTSKVGCWWRELKYQVALAKYRHDCPPDYKTLRSRVGYMIGFFAGIWLPRIRDYAEYCELQAKISSVSPAFDESDVCSPKIRYLDFWGPFRPYATRYYKDTIMVPFENTEVPVPADYDGYLKEYFGDYMSLPPESDRIPKHELEPVALWRNGPTGV